MQNAQSLNEALEEFYMVQTVRGNSAATVRDYRQKLGVFASFKAISYFEIISARLCGWFPSEILALMLVPLLLIWSANPRSPFPCKIRATTIANKKVRAVKITPASGYKTPGVRNVLLHE